MIKTLQAATIMEEEEDTSSEQTSQYPQASLMNSQQNVWRSQQKQQQQTHSYNALQIGSGKDEGVIEESKQEQEVYQLPQEIQELLQFDESLYDLMRHKSSFKFQFGKEFLPGMIDEEQRQLLNKRSKQLVNSFMCFNNFFFVKEYMSQKQLLEINHSQSTEKTQLLHLIMSELLREQSFKQQSESKTIAPHILLFDNTQKIDYRALKNMIKQTIIDCENYKQNVANNRSQISTQAFEQLAEKISVDCLSKLHVISSRSQLEFCVNIRALKHILTHRKEIRIVIIDTINAFHIDNEQFNMSNNMNNNNNNNNISNNKDDDKSNEKKKRSNNNNNTNKFSGNFSTIKGSLQRQYDQVVKEYLEEVYSKFTRVSFIATKRDYYKVKNLIDIVENTNRFKANVELINLLQNDRIYIDEHAYKSFSTDYEISQIYTLSLDNFSRPALEKALELIRQNPGINQQGEEEGTFLPINPQKVSVVVKKNYIFVDEQMEQPEDEEAAAFHKEQLKLKQYTYLMNFYTFTNNQFRPLSDNSFYFS